MNKKFLLLITFSLLFQISAIAQSKIPHLKKQAGYTQLIVKDKPFLVLGGELGNSTFTSVESMAPVWPKLKAMNLNTVLAPVYWELIEPEEGKFDFKLLDDLIAESRKQDLKLVLLWFGSWKNSMSSHVPVWIKQNEEKYPRAKDEKYQGQEILTPFSENNLQADLKAFRVLMQHIKETDSVHHTVIMVQPENEIGMLPSARDYHPLANEKFKADVPIELIRYLQKNKEQLVPEFFAVWKKNGFKTKGNWEEIFGKGYHTDEIFMAWYFAKFTEAVTKAGKEVYPLPMFVNAALIRPGKIPGEYPSAGPLPHLMDLWKAAAPSVDMLSPDFYNPDFEYWNDLYVRQNNPLFVPEHRFDGTAAAKALFSIGHYRAIGFSPFSIESTNQPEKENLGKVYRLVREIEHLLTGDYGIDAVLLDKEKPQSTIVLGDYEFSFKNSYSLGWEAGATNEQWDFGSAVVIQTGEKEFYIAGSGVVATFKNQRQREKTVGILKNEQGTFKNGKWEVHRHLNGDQTHQGRHVRIAHDVHQVLRLELYEYR
jgi:beta-galactosidase GanA